MKRAQNTELARLARARGPYCELHSLLALHPLGASLGLAPRRRLNAQVSGSRTSNTRGRGIEFEEVRLYAAGDDVRNIDWRVTARTGRPHTKLFREERERPVFLFVDQRATMFFGSRVTLKSVQAAHAAALLAWATLHEGDRVGGLIFNDREHHEIRPRRSRRAVIQLLRRLHQMNRELRPLAGAPAVTLGLAEALQSMRRIARPGSMVIVLSDFHGFNEECERQLALLARHAELAAVCVHDPLEARLPAGGSGVVSDGLRDAWLDTGNSRVRARHAQHHAQRRAALQSALGRIGAPLIGLATDEPALDVLLRHFRGRTR